MEFLKNWRADRNAGKLEVSKQRVEDMKNGVQRTKEEQKALNKELNLLGIRKNKQARFLQPTSKPAQVKNRTNVIHQEANGIKVEEANLIKTGKNSKEPNYAAINKGKNAKFKKN